MSLVVGLVLIATTAIASTISAPTISESKGMVSDILQTTSFRLGITLDKDLKDYLAQQVAKYGGNYYLLEKVISCEAGWNIDAKNPDSAASGLAQFMPSTFKGWCGGDYDNPRAQIHCLVVAWTAGKEGWWSESKPCWQDWKNLYN